MLRDNMDLIWKKKKVLDALHVLCSPFRTFLCHSCPIHDVESPVLQLYGRHKHLAGQQSYSFFFVTQLLSFHFCVNDRSYERYFGNSESTLFF